MIFDYGAQTRDIVHVKDVVKANIQAISSGEPGVFNVAYGQRINLCELADMMMKITGSTVPVTFRPPAHGDVRDSLADISQARNALGYAPEYSVKTGLAETVRWFRQQSE